MSTSSFPTDLFDKEYREKKERKLSYFVSKYAKQRFLPYLRVPVEYTIIAGILILVLMILSYAVGVERGKRQVAVLEAQDAREDVLLTVAEIPDMPAGVTETGGPVLPGDVADQAGPYAEETSLPIEEETPTGEKYPVSVPEESAYMVQLASFKTEKYAREEVSKLEAKGEHAGYLKAGDWYQVYAEGYNTIDQARDAQKAFNDIYPGCYVRRRK
ncbi:MAG: hypothetical protein DRP08_04575 [Candidatus Aenigmatarchaeota archaeon]|nr:MAG: hypothetical protein DRP08_04575 [Candidatus Aenigmarchaeota archaeon]